MIKNPQCIIEEENFVDLLPFGAWECTPEGIYTYLSPSFLQLIDLSAPHPHPSLDSLSWFHHLLDDEREEFIFNWKKCLHEGRIWDYEFQLQGKDGNLYTIL